MYDLIKGTTMKSICSCARVTFKESKGGIKSCWLQNKVQKKSFAVNKRDATPVSEKGRQEVFLKNFALNGKVKLKKCPAIWCQTGISFILFYFFIIIIFNVTTSEGRVVHSCTQSSTFLKRSASIKHT